MTCKGCALWDEVDERLFEMEEKDLACFVTKAIILLWSKQPGDFDYTFADLVGGVNAFFEETQKGKMN